MTAPHMHAWGTRSGFFLPRSVLDELGAPGHASQGSLIVFAPTKKLAVEAATNAHAQVKYDQLLRDESVYANALRPYVDAERYHSVGAVFAKYNYAVVETTSQNPAIRHGLFHNPTPQRSSVSWAPVESTPEPEDPALAAMKLECAEDVAEQARSLLRITNQMPLLPLGLIEPVKRLRHAVFEFDQVGE